VSSGCQDGSREGREVWIRWNWWRWFSSRWRQSDTHRWEGIGDLVWPRVRILNVFCSGKLETTKSMRIREVLYVIFAKPYLKRLMLMLLSVVASQMMRRNGPAMKWRDICFTVFSSTAFVIQMSIQYNERYTWVVPVVLLSIVCRSHVV